MAELGTPEEHAGLASKVPSRRRRGFLRYASFGLGLVTMAVLAVANRPWESAFWLGAFIADISVPGVMVLVVILVQKVLMRRRSLQPALFWVLVVSLLLAIPLGYTGPSAHLRHEAPDDSDPLKAALLEYALDLQTSVSAGGEIPTLDDAAQRFGRLAPLAIAFNQYVRESQCDYLAYVAFAESVHLDSITAPSSLSFKQGVSGTTRVLRRAAQVAESLEFRSCELTLRLYRVVEQMDTPERIEREILNGMRSTGRRTDGIYTAYFERERSLIGRLTAVYEFLDSRHGTYSFKNEQLVFSSAIDSDSFAVLVSMLLSATKD